MKDTRIACLSCWASRAEGPLRPSVIQMLGMAEPSLRRGCACGKTLVRRKNAAGQKAGLWSSYTFSRFQNIVFNCPFQKRGQEKYWAESPLVSRLPRPADQRICGPHCFDISALALRSGGAQTRILNGGTRIWRGSAGRPYPDRPPPRLAPPFQSFLVPLNPRAAAKMPMTMTYAQIHSATIVISVP